MCVWMGESDKLSVDWKSTIEMQAHVPFGGFCKSLLKNLGYRNKEQIQNVIWLHTFFCFAFWEPDWFGKIFYSLTNLIV